GRQQRARFTGAEHGRARGAVKLLHVISSADPRHGGPIEGIRQLAAARSSREHEVEIASADDPEAAFVRTSPLPLHPLGPGHTHYRYASRFLPWLRSNAQRYDAVIVNGLWQYTTLATWIALRGTGIPYFVFTHGMLDPWFKCAYPLKHAKK